MPGGKKPGAGVKQDSIRPKFTAYWSQDDIKEYMEWLKNNYKDKPELAKYVGDHLFGKPIQPLTGDGGGPIQFSGVNIKIQK